MGINHKVPTFVVFWTISTIKDEKSAAKFHYMKTVSGEVVAQSIAFRVVSIYWQWVAPFPWYLKYRPPRRPHCIRRVPSAPRNGHSTPPLRPMSIVATVAHLSYCWALVQTVAQKLQHNRLYRDREKKREREKWGARWGAELQSIHPWNERLHRRSYNTQWKLIACHQ